MSEQFKTSQESSLQQDVAKVLGKIPWKSFLLAGALNNNSPAFAQEVKYTGVEQLANQAEIQPAKKPENINSSLQEMMSKIPADVKPGDSFLVKKNPDGTFTFTPQTIPVNDKCKPQIPTNPVTIGLGAGRGGVNITPGKI